MILCQTYDMDDNVFDSDDSLMVKKCCLKPGPNTLKCYNTPKWVAPILGWRYAQLEIDGHGYCDDFIAPSALRKVMILGKYI